MALSLLSIAAIGFGCATMALVHKDQQIANLLKHAEKQSAKNQEFLTSILACANGGGFTLDMDQHHMVHVQCNIKYEWMRGKFYDEEASKKLRKK